MWVTDVLQWGLSCYEHYLGGGGREWCDGALSAADHLVATQRREAPFAGAWPYGYPYPHTFRLEPPWVMGMAQGQAASLLVRAALETGRERYARAAREALQPLRRAVDEPGGLRATLPTGGVIFEEYPTRPPSHVLNGGIFTLFGLFDVWKGLGDLRAREDFHAGVEGLAGGLHLWDLGYWSRYDLFPHALVNVASPFYHRLHVTQLQAMERIAGDDRLSEVRRRYESYLRRPDHRARAVTTKVAFRLAVPRNPRLAALRRRRPRRTPAGPRGRAGA